VPTSAKRAPKNANAIITSTASPAPRSATAAPKNAERWRWRGFKIGFLFLPPPLPLLAGIGGPEEFGTEEVEVAR
jgi:hypothetical protein